VTGGGLLVRVVKWRYHMYHHLVGCSVNKVVGLWGGHSDQSIHWGGIIVGFAMGW
jgi:hypothetical protein